MQTKKFGITSREKDSVPKNGLFVHCDMLAISFILIMLLCISCGKNHDAHDYEYVDIGDVEGTYIGIFTDQNNHEKAEDGNVTITKLSDGLYTLSLICDGHNLHEKAEGVKFYYSRNGLTCLENEFGDNYPEYWSVNGWFQSDGLFIHCYKHIYGDYDGKSMYYFRYGKKIN